MEVPKSWMVLDVFFNGNPMKIDVFFWVYPHFRRPPLIGELGLKKGGISIVNGHIIIIQWI